MPIYLDDHAVDLPGSDISAILNAASQQLSAAGRIIIEVELDGQRLLSNDLALRGTQTLGNSELRLFSDEIRNIALAALQSLDDELNHAAEAQAQTAAFLRQDRQKEALSSLSDTMTRWQHIQQAVLQSAQLLRIDLASLDVDGRSITELTDALIAQLKSLQSSIQALDTVGLADDLKYEWPDTVEHWRQLVHALIDHIEKP